MSGCPIGCRFCGAGDNFVRVLTSAEICEQVMHLVASTGVDPHEMKRLQVMFMSMGEPMLNWNNLKDAIHILHDYYPNAALLISSSGPAVILPYGELVNLAAEIPQIGLQFSIHESTDEARDLLIPFKKKLPLSDIALVGETFFRKTGRQAFFNYCVHEKNNTVEDADRLKALFDPKYWQATISVICERNEYVAAANERQAELAANFCSLLIERGYSTRVFNPAGQDDIGGG